MNEENKKPRLRIRKLTEGECYRLMGFQKKDHDACKEVGQSAANIYHQAGDSIVTTVLAALFGELLGIDYKTKIEEYCDSLHQETEICAYAVNRLKGLSDASGYGKGFVQGGLLDD